MTVSPRPIVLSDFEDLHKWWAAQEWPTMDARVLPLSGWIIPGVCAAFLYQANSPMAKLEWIVGNPDCDPNERSAGLDTLISFIGTEAKHLGYDFMFTGTQHAALIKRLVDHKYMVCDQNVTHLIKYL